MSAWHPAVVLAPDRLYLVRRKPGLLFWLEPATEAWDGQHVLNQRFPRPVRLLPPLQDVARLSGMLRETDDGLALHESEDTQQDERVFESG